MAPERVTVTIRSSAGEDAPLTVEDAMRQLLDFFDLLATAGGEEGSAVAWQLVDVSMSSPLTATAEAVSKVPGIPAGPIARREKAEVADSVAALVEGGPPPDWMDYAARNQLRGLLERNTNGIGRTDIDFQDVAAPVIVTEQAARSGLAALSRYESAVLTNELVDRSHTEIGSIEGFVTDTTTYHDRLSIWVRDRLTGSRVRCIFSDELAESVAPKHDWAEVWKHGRVLVSGKVHYNTQGKPFRVEASNIRTVNPRALRYGDLADPNFTGGLSPSEHISSLWEEDVG